MEQIPQDKVPAKTKIEKNSNNRKNYYMYMYMYMYSMITRLTSSTLKVSYGDFGSDISTNMN